MKTVSEQDIQTIDSLFSSIQDDGYRKTIIAENAKKFILNEFFVSHFIDYITPELFSSSAELSASLIKIHPELFLFNSWSENRKKDLTVLMDETTRNIIINKSGTDDFWNSEKLYSAIKSTDFSQLTKETFEFLLTKTNSTDIVSILFGIAKTEYISKELVLKYAGKLNEAAFNVNKNLSEFLTPADREVVLKQKPISLKFFLSRFVFSGGRIGWMNKMIDEAIDGNIVIEETGSTLDSYIVNALKEADVNYLEKFAELIRSKAPNALSYEVLSTILTEFDPDESFMMNFAEEFKKNQLIRAAGTYCKDNGFETALLLYVL